MKKVIHTNKAPEAIGPYSQAIESGNTLYVSGQVPKNPKTGDIPEGIEEQTKQVMENIGAILSEAGYTFQHVVKCTCLMKDLTQFSDMNTVYGSYFQESPPARAAFEVARLPLDVLIEIECIATK